MNGKELHKGTTSRLNTAIRLSTRAMLAGAFALLGGHAPIAQAALITVTTLVDEVAINGECSLREAIRAANLDAAVDTCAAGSGADEIVFHPSVEAGFFSLTIHGTGEDAGLTGDLDITGDLTIRGAGFQTIIDAGGIDRVFQVHHSATLVEFVGLAIRSGVVVGNGGGIASSRNVIVRNCLIQGNQATAGGGIYASAPLTIVDSVISGNTAAGLGGGVQVFDADLLSVTRSAFAGNQAMDGGGLYVKFTRPTIADSSFVYNEVTNQGGAIYYEGAQNVPLTISSSTIAYNNATVGWPAGVSTFHPFEATIVNTIFDQNWLDSTYLDNCIGGSISLGHNMISADSYTCASTTVPHPTDIYDDPGLQGFPWSYSLALAQGSPAIDAGDPAHCGSLDQLGNARSQDGDADGVPRCDIGAVEFEPTVAAVHSQVDPAAGSRIAVCVQIDTSASGESLGSYGVTLAWDPAVLAFHDASGGAAPFDNPLFNTADVASGQLGIADAAPAGAVGEINVACVLFDVTGAAGTASAVDLEITSLFSAGTFVDLEPEATVAERDATVVRECTIGDVNADGVVNSGDALLILSAEIGLPIPAVATDGLRARCGDANGDGASDSIDANVILSFEVGLDLDPGLPLGDSNITVDECACATLGCVAAPPGLVSWWDGDDISGTTVGDIHGTNDGTLLNGASIAPGRVGNAFSFDGVDDQVSMPDAPSLDLDQAMALALWVNIVADDPEQHLVAKWGLGGGWDLIMYPFDPAVWEYRTLIDGQFGEIDCPEVVPGAWVHVVAQYDGAATKVYTNGVLCVSDSRAGDLFVNDAPLIFGGGNSYRFGGMLDEVQLYDRALSDEEIASIWSAGEKGVCKTGGGGDAKRAAGARVATDPAGRIEARLTPSGARRGGGDIEYTVVVDTSAAATAVGSYGARLAWDPADLQLVEVLGGRTRGFERPLINRAAVAEGRLRFSQASPRGAAGEVEVLRLRFRPLDSGGRTASGERVTLSFSSLGAPGPAFENLLPRVDVRPARVRSSR